MKKLNPFTIIVAAVLSLLIYTAKAEESPSLWQRGIEYAKPSSDGLFTEKVSLSIGALYSVPDQRQIDHPFDTDQTKGDWGLSAEVGLWLSRNVAVTAETGIIDIGNPNAGIIDHYAVGLKVRAPIGRYAPYIGGNVGRDLRDGTYYATARVGIEGKINRDLGTFTDIGWQFRDEEKDVLAWRLGLTF